MDLITRKENLLGLIAGEEGAVLPEPPYITREEKLLYAIYLNGGGGGVTPEYVAEAIAEAKTDIEAEIPTKTSDLTNDSGYAAIDDTTAAQNKAYSSAKVEEKVAGEEITTTATGSDLTLSTSAGNLNALTVYGKSEVVDGSIKSAGEGYAVVDLGTLNWNAESSPERHVFRSSLANVSPAAKPPSISGLSLGNYLCGEYLQKAWSPLSTNDDGCYAISPGLSISIVEHDYSNVADFVAHISGLMFAYELADPTQGNCIAIKTDDGTGVNGTMATFTTGTPLRGIPDSNVRDVMVWDGVSGEVTKNGGVVDLGTLMWSYLDNRFITTAGINNIKPGVRTVPILCAKYTALMSGEPYPAPTDDKVIYAANTNICVHDSDYTDATDFKTAMSGVMLVYELATPTTQQLTTAENDSIAALRTFTPQTHAQNNAGAEMTVKAYAGTENGKAVADLKSALQITQSDTLALTTAGWSSNTQAVAYAHDTAKRNVIDVDPASVEEWASCGVLATSETASGITFSCKTVPENALTFRVTSMGV